MTEENFNEINTDQDSSERRRYVRVPFQKSIKYRLCYEKFSNQIIEADASNISQTGILFKTKYPPPVSSIISLQVDPGKLKEYCQKEDLLDVIDVEKLYIKGSSVFGEVVRVVLDQASGFSSVAVKLVLNKDPKAGAKVEEAKKIKQHPQYIDPSQIPDEEKIDPQQNKKSHPQYIDPSLAEDEDENFNR